jgi:5-methyltetrahydropteroyltriglutamate--homocysteine methyltransferase
MKTDKMKTLPPFYTQVIGSLPRPDIVLDLLKQKKEMSSDRYEKVMGEMVTFAIRLQEEAGIDVVSDGEWRRIHYTDEFLERIGGFEPVRKFEHQGEIKYTRVVVKKIKIDRPVFTQDADFLIQHTDRVTKFALPSPFLIAVRYWHEDYSRDAYPTREHLMMELAGILKKEAEILVETGIDIIQIDDPALTYFCDTRLTSGKKIHDERLHKGWDADTEVPKAVQAINMITGGLKAETHLHCCHSVYKRMSDVIGNYKPILPLLKDADIDRVNLEFAYKDTGDISDMEFLPDQMSVGMGVIDVRQEKVNPVDEIVTKVLKAANLIDPGRIALNPDCGFAPDAYEPPTIDEAFRKLKRLSEAAKILREKSGRF